MNIKETITARRSVRTYDGKPLSDDDKKAISDCFPACENPFGLDVEFRLLSAKEHGLTSPVLVGANDYVAAKIKREDNFEVAYGYSFEAFILAATALNIGTVMLGGTFNRKAFEAAMQVTETESMPLASPVGYPAAKKSVREKMMRKAIGADKRMPFEELFFENTLSNGLTREKAGALADALEMVRLAPSAVNKQPWRVVVCGDTVHFFKKRAKSLSGGSFDIQKVDMGIALCHFVLTLKEHGVTGSFVIQKPEFDVPEDTEYIISYTI